MGVKFPSGGGSSKPSSQTILADSFKAETLAIARLRMPKAGLNRAIGTDLTDDLSAAALSTGVGTSPVLDSTFTGGVYGLSNATIALNPTAPGAATYNPILGSLENPMSESYMGRIRFWIDAAVFTTGTQVRLLSLENQATPAHCIQLRSNGSTSTTQLFIDLAGTLFSCGPDGVLAGGNSFVPRAQMVTASFYFDITTGLFKWEFGDVINPLNALSGSQLNTMPVDATSFLTRSNDTTIGNNFKVDALAFAYQASFV